MRIGIVCPYSFDEPGGVQAHILDLARWLNDHGHETGVIGPCSADTPVPDFVTRGGGSIAVPYNGSVARLSVGPQVKAKLAGFITDGRFDVLHIHEPNSPSYSMAALRMCHGPIVATFHTSGAESKALRLVRPALKPLLEKIRGGIAVSEMARRFQVNQLGGDPVLIPNGVDTSFFAAARQRRADAHTGARDAVSHHSPLEIVFLGRLNEPRKGFQVLHAALDHLTCPVHVTVMGSGSFSPDDRITYVGRVSDQQKADYLAASDVYVAPNTGGESFGIVLIEAMAAGTAVVASDLEAFCAVTDIDSDRPAGIVFPTGDARALAAAIDRLAAQPDLRQSLVEAGVQRCAAYDWDVVARDVLRVYETVADGTVVTA